jgi:ribose 5-phosphate isomerase A
VVRFGWRSTLARLLDGVVTAADVRCLDDRTPFITDEGHVIVDCAVPPDGDLGEFAVRLKAVVGVVEHGLFLGMADEALLGATDGTLQTIPS